MTNTINLRKEVAALVRTALQAVQDAGDLPAFDIPEHIPADASKRANQGDYGTPVCMGLARELRQAPIKIAQAVAKHVPDAPFIGKVDVAPPGFINFTLDAAWLGECVPAILDAGETWGNVDEGAGQRVQVEYVSANPTGPITIASARNAVIGDVVASVLEAAGYDISREYYVNDAGSKVRHFGGSILSRYAAALGVDIPFPEKGYPASYVTDLGNKAAAEFGDTYLHVEHYEAIRALFHWGIGEVLKGVEEDLGLLGVKFQNWFYESSLYSSGLFDEMMDKLREGGFIKDYDGATWFSHPDLDKDAVLIRSADVISEPEARPTYLASDIPYLWNKLEVRKFDRAIYVWGADHHGDVPRVLAAAKAVGVDPERLTMIIYQMVTLLRGGEEVRMSKSSGEFVTLREVMDETGPDPIRFMLLTRTNDVTMEFDIDLALEQSDRNPVYYVKYAHTRIAGVLRHAEEQGWDVNTDGDVRLLTHPSELALIKKMLNLSEVITVSARNLAPHHLTTYASELASEFHAFYRDCHVVQPENPELTKARLMLARSAKSVLARVLHLMGMSAPDHM